MSPHVVLSGVGYPPSHSLYNLRGFPTIIPCSSCRLILGAQEHLMVSSHFYPATGLFMWIGCGFVYPESGRECPRGATWKGADLEQAARMHELTSCSGSQDKPHNALSVKPAQAPSKWGLEARPCGSSML